MKDIKAWERREKQDKVHHMLHAVLATETTILYFPSFMGVLSVVMSIKNWNNA